jgi:DNA-binding CsgD family transcriptional regulator
VADYLSPRELEIALLLASGLTNKEVAARLVIANRTVRNTITHIYAKLGVQSRGALILKLLNLGLLKPNISHDASTYVRCVCGRTLRVTVEAL